MRTIYQDVRYGLRVMLNSPGFTAVAMLTLALGLAVNTTVFGWIETVLLRPFPGVADPDNLFVLETSTSTQEAVGMSYTDYRDYRDHLKLVSGLAVARFTELSVGPAGRTQRMWGELVSGNYFDLVGVRPRLGRSISEREAGEVPVVVISHRLWQSRFRSDPAILGKTIRVSRNELTIIGVAPPGFRGTTAGVIHDMWAPIGMARALGTGTGTLTYRATRDIVTTLARLKPGVTVEQAAEEVAGIARTLGALYPDTNRGISATLRPVSRAHNGVQPFLVKPLTILLAVCFLLLLIVCANIANLLLSRAVARQREFAVRAAMGAGRWRLTRQLLTETLLLASMGAVLGTILSMWMTQGLELLLPSGELPVFLQGNVSVRSLLFTMAVTVLVTVISGTAPALLSARDNIAETLKQGGGRSGQAGSNSHRLRGALVISEVALATVGLICAGLFFRSFQNASMIHPGFDTGRTLTAQFYLSTAGYSGAEQRQFCRALRERMEALPSVTAVSYADAIPLNLTPTPFHNLEVEGYLPGGNQDMRIHRTFIPPGYFDLLGIPMIDGRDFTLNDQGRETPQVIIINETFAHRFFRGANPLGRRVKMERKWTTVVGVVKDIKYHSPSEPRLAFFYAPFDQNFAPGLNFTFFVKTKGDPRMVVEPLRREALSLNGDAVFSARTLWEATLAALYPAKVASSLLGVLGAACLLLAAIGLYSVISYAVTQRTQELGIRIALGARPVSVLGLILGEGLRLTIPGLALGMVAALFACRLIAGMLVGVSPADPLTFSVATGGLCLIAMIASYVPARRATKLNPVDSLRCT